MSENYIVINGKKAELTPEQLKALGLEKEIKNPFERKHEERYYFINWSGTVITETETDSASNRIAFKVANYCTDYELMKQRALHETLNRLLWRYSMEHGGREINWADREDKWYIYYDYTKAEWDTEYDLYTRAFGAPYFLTETIAENAIKEIVEPFMAEHPDFEF